MFLYIYFYKFQIIKIIKKRLVIHKTHVVEGLKDPLEASDKEIFAGEDSSSYLIIRIFFFEPWNSIVYCHILGTDIHFNLTSPIFREDKRNLSLFGDDGLNIDATIYIAFKTFNWCIHNLFPFLLFWLDIFYIYIYVYLFYLVFSRFSTSK